MSGKQEKIYVKGWGWLFLWNGDTEADRRRRGIESEGDNLDNDQLFKGRFTDFVYRDRGLYIP